MIARIPSPGYPAFPLVVGDHIYEGTYTNPAGDSIPSHVFEYDAAGNLRQTFRHPRPGLAQAPGVQAATARWAA